MKRILIATAAVGIWGFAQTIAATDGHPDPRIDVMTMNQYLGADLFPLADPKVDFNDAMETVLQEVATTDFPSRAVALARIIAKRHPELVGLQEVFSFTCDDLGPKIQDQGCDNPGIRDAFDDPDNDRLQLTLDAISAQGESYEAVATVMNFNTLALHVPGAPCCGIPFVIDGHPVLVNIGDRDVILVRSDLALAGDAQPVDNKGRFKHGGLGCKKEYRSADGCNYEAVATFPVPLPDGSPDASLDFFFKRGFVGVDVTINDIDYRFINTHLEVQQPDVRNPLSAIVQAAQAAELIETLDKSTPERTRLIVVGDINSSPEDPIILPPQPPQGFPEEIIPPYTQFVEAGYMDAWTLQPGNRPSYTCCQDADLLNRKSVLDERIDVIFSLETPWKIVKADVLGARIGDKTSPPGQGLWPSDHASVAAEFRF